MSAKSNFYKLLSLPHSILFQQRPEIPSNVADCMAFITASRRAMWSKGGALITGPFLNLHRDYIVPCLRLRSKILELESRGNLSSDAHGVRARELTRCQNEFMLLWRDLQQRQYEICNNNFNSFMNCWVAETEQTLNKVRQCLRSREASAAVDERKQLQTFIPISKDIPQSGQASVLTDDGLPAMDNDEACASKAAAACIAIRDVPSSRAFGPYDWHRDDGYSAYDCDLMDLESDSIFSDYHGSNEAKSWTPGKMTNAGLSGGFLSALWQRPAEFIKSTVSAVTGSGSSSTSQSSAIQSSAANAAWTPSTATGVSSASLSGSDTFHAPASFPVAGATGTDIGTASSLTHDDIGATSQPAAAEEGLRVDPMLQEGDEAVVTRKPSLGLTDRLNRLLNKDTQA